MNYYGCILDCKFPPDGYFYSFLCDLLFVLHSALYCSMDFGFIQLVYLFYKEIFERAPIKNQPSAASRSNFSFF